MPPPHSDLPIIHLDTPPPPRLSAREKYGSLLYLGIGGLAVTVALLVWFAVGVWSLRDVFSHVYVLHDATQPEDRRIEAAYALSRDARVTQRQYWDICLRKALPGLARYLIAEALTTEAVADDPKAFADAVAYSEGWPDWLRLQLLRAMASAAGDGVRLPLKPLQHLARHRDPTIALWANYTLAVSRHDPEAAETMLSREATAGGPRAELAGLLLKAEHADDAGRTETLRLAARWLRTHHAPSAELWRGWEEREGRLVRKTALELPKASSSLVPGLAPSTGRVDRGRLTLSGGLRCASPSRTR